MRKVLVGAVVLAVAGVVAGCSPQPSGQIGVQLATPAAHGEVRSVDLMIDAPQGASAVAIVCRGATAVLVTELLGAEIADELDPESPGFLAAIVYLNAGEAVATEEFGQGSSASDWLFVPCPEAGSLTGSVTLLDGARASVDFVFVDDPVHPRWYLEGDAG